MQGKVVYRFETPRYPGDILYVNIVARYSCVNDCHFCGRPRKPAEFGRSNIYEKKAGCSLYLESSPSPYRVMREIDREIRPGDKELAFVGLGEPLMRLPAVVEVTRRTKEKYPLRTRVDTNGLAKCMHRNPAQRLEAAGLDEIRISLNATNEREYEELCRPKFKDAFPNIVEFVRECAASSIDTHVSFVVNFENGEVKTRAAEEYAAFAESLGIKPEKIIFRDYVPIDF
jgi:TatD family-associated radical SAM protein